MKTLMLAVAVLGLSLSTRHLSAAPALEQVKAQVLKAAKQAGADPATLDRAVPVQGARRSQAGQTTVPIVDNILLLAAQSAAKAAEARGATCSLENCPHTTSLDDARKALSGLKGELADGKAATTGEAGVLHHAAASILKASRDRTIHFDPNAKFQRSQVVKMPDDLKLELAADLAESTQALINAGK